MASQAKKPPMGVEKSCSRNQGRSRPCAADDVAVEQQELAQDAHRVGLGVRGDLLDEVAGEPVESAVEEDRPISI
jgi:hypothetical protein